MEITELLKVIAWSLFGVTAIAGFMTGLLVVAAGRAARAEQERHEAYDEASS